MTKELGEHKQNIITKIKFAWLPKTIRSNDGRYYKIFWSFYTVQYILTTEGYTISSTDLCSAVPGRWNYR